MLFYILLFLVDAFIFEAQIENGGTITTSNVAHDQLNKPLKSTKFIFCSLFNNVEV